MTPRPLRGALAFAVVLPGLLVWPTSAAAQRRNGGGEQAGTAVSRPSSPPPAPAPTPTSGPATASGESRRGSEGSAPTGGQATGDGSARRRSGDGERVGTAVPRDGGRERGGRNPVIIIPGGYYPWGYGGLGFGGYYGGYYDPWYDPYGYSGFGYGGGYPGYSSYSRSSRSYDEGALRIKVKPREASVYVDGYFAGIVDDFDGVLQKMHLSSGPHRIEVRLAGYESLAFDVRIEPDETITYHGDLKKAP